MHSESKHKRSVALYAARLLFAIVILGLDIYIIQYFSDTVLVISSVIASVTMLACMYSITKLCVYEKIHHPKVELGLHLLMSSLWLVDLGIILFIVLYWRISDTGVNFEIWLTRGLMGDFELALWLFEAFVLVRDMIKHNLSSSYQEHIPLTRVHTAHRFDFTSSSRVEPWAISPSEPPRSEPQPILPENDAGYGALALAPSRELSEQASADSSVQRFSELRPQQALNPTTGSDRRGTVIAQDAVEPVSISHTGWPIRKQEDL